MAVKAAGKGRGETPARSSLKRYRPIKGASRRYYDTVSHRSISWYDWDARVHKGVPAPTRHAQERGYRTRYQRGKAARHALTGGQRQGPEYSFAVPETVEARKHRERRLATRARQRADARQRDLARSWWVHKHGPAAEFDPKRALSDPEFQRLTERLRALEAEEATHVHTHGTDDPFYAPFGQYAKVLEALGRRPEDYPYEPGDSPVGTVYYMNYAPEVAA